MAQTQTTMPNAANKDRARYEMQFYKTRVCSFYANGKCTRGAMCKYAHGDTELQSRPDLTFTSLCREFSMTGACTNPACSFAHDPSELRATHKFFKTSLCKFHLRGRCRLGEECRHAHGEDELIPLSKSEANAPTAPVSPASPGMAFDPTFAASLLLSVAAAGSKLGPVYRSPAVETPSYAPWPELDFRGVSHLEPARIPGYDNEEPLPTATLASFATPSLAPPGLFGVSGDAKETKSFSSFSTAAGYSSFSSASSISSLEDEPLQVELPADWKLSI